MAFTSLVDDLLNQHRLTCMIYRIADLAGKLAADGLFRFALSSFIFVLHVMVSSRASCTSH